MCFTSLVRFIPKHFLMQFWKILIFFMFPFSYFIVNVKKWNQFLYVNLVSCYFAEFISYNNFCMESLVISVYNIMSSYHQVVSWQLCYFPTSSNNFSFFFFSDCCGWGSQCNVEVMRVGILVWFQILAERILAFYHWV